MLKTLKWVYKLGYSKARAEVFELLEKEAGFQNLQSQIKALQKQEDFGKGPYQNKRITSNDHEQRYKEVCEIQRRLDPNKYPDIEKWMDMML